MSQFGGGSAAKAHREVARVTARSILERMARALRIVYPDATYHVFARGNRRSELYLDRFDYKLFIQILAAVTLRYGWSVIAYCLMPNHYHLVVRVPQENISTGMHRLNFRYAQLFNDRHGLDGHVLQGRFKSRVIESEEYLLDVARYIHLNPVRARLCTHPAHWFWSSYSATVGIVPQPAFLACDEITVLFGHDRAAYAAFVEEAIPPVSPPAMARA
jgi:REP element-mobilizing transposase RayT